MVPDWFAAVARARLRRRLASRLSAARWVLAFAGTTRLKRRHCTGGVSIIVTDRPRNWPWPIVAAAIFVALALVTPINHDENQYVAAAWLTARGLRPFADYLYLQTPLQPWLLAPVAAASDGWTFIALRLANGGAGVLTLLVVFAAQRSAGVASRDARLTAALLGCSYVFLLCISVARNDVLPTLLLALALWAGTRGDARGWGLAGLALGLAASLKISFAMPLGAGGLWLLVEWLRAPTRRSANAVVAWGIGGLVGLLPCLAAWLQAPEAFLYGVLQYPSEAGFDWYRLNGVGDRLTWFAKARDTLLWLAVGPSLIALPLLVALHLRGPRPDTAVHRLAGFVDALIVGGIVGALLPTPSHGPYFSVVLPQLFVRLGLAAPAWRHRLWARVGLKAMALAGLLVHGFYGLYDRAQHGGAFALRVEAQARWIGAQVRAADREGEIATFSPLYTVDSGVPLDRRFATGVFVFRSGNLRSDAELARLRALSPRTLFRELDARPPIAVLTGFEGKSGINRTLLPDRALDAWARSRGYRPVRNQWGGLLWLAPQR